MGLRAAAAASEAATGGAASRSLSRAERIAEQVPGARSQAGGLAQIHPSDLPLSMRQALPAEAKLVLTIDEGGR